MINLIIRKIIIIFFVILLMKIILMKKLWELDFPTYKKEIITKNKFFSQQIILLSIIKKISLDNLRMLMLNEIFFKNKSRKNKK